jgi:hypothetical protein
MEAADLIEVVRRHLEGVVKTGELDVQAEPVGECDLFTDDWTLHLDPTGGFLAIEDEPDTPAAYRAAIQKWMSPAVIAAIASADRELGGEVTARLRATADPLSLEFVSMLTEVAA